MNRFFIIVTGWNCAPFVERCHRSIECNDFNKEVVYCLDGCTDNSKDVLMESHKSYWTFNDCKKKDILIQETSNNVGAAWHRNEALKLAHEDDIVLFVGMDDELMPNALERINQEYEQGKLMTYGNWINQDGNGLPADFDLEFPDSVHNDRSYRRVKYRSTAPNTFRRFLYDCIKPEDLQFNGEWYKATTESEVMFSCLEQCGKDRIGVIKEPIYLYNQQREQNARKRFGIDYQAKIYNHVINKPKRELWSSSK